MTKQELLNKYNSFYHSGKEAMVLCVEVNNDKFKYQKIVISRHPPSELREIIDKYNEDLVSGCSKIINMSLINADKIFAYLFL